MATLAPLPIYPSTQARKGFSASQLVHFHANLSNVIARVIVLPPAKRDAPSTRAFVSSYAGDGAQQVLNALIWEDAKPEKHDDRLHHRVLLLAEKIAPGLEPRTLLDLCVTFPSKITRLNSLLSAALGGTPTLPTTLASEVVPAFTSLLSQTSSLGLYGLRKTARCVTSLLRPSPPDLVRPFAHSSDFLLALARAYDDGLTAIGRSYGGFRAHAADRALDHWERIWLETKVDMVDAFHLVVTTMVQDISAASGTRLAAEADRTFGIVFALLDVGAPARSADAVPFLDRSLVADYQYAYDLGRTLSSALRHASRDDARLELLESTLRSLDLTSADGSAKDPGVLKLVLHSSGIMSGVSDTPAATTSIDKGKGKAAAPTPPSSHDANLEAQVKQVLEIFPDYAPDYIRKLLVHPSFPFHGNAERVIESLLEGTAPDENALAEAVVPLTDAPIERQNVFDQEVMDLNRVHLGKKKHDVTLTRDRIEVERMKADILRLAEGMSEDSDDDADKALDVFDLDDDLDGAGANTVKILGDDSDDEEGGEEHRVDPVKPETILELAYLRDPKLFDRDAQTRQSKQRADLKRQTGDYHAIKSAIGVANDLFPGWIDEQIEGWRIMLERNPKKDRILQKHEFSGNRAIGVPVDIGTSTRPSEGQRGRGRGRGRRGGGHGGGGSGRGEPGEKKDEAVKRAFKERHKSDHRKRGHDRKMTKAGAGPSG